MADDEERTAWAEYLEACQLADDDMKEIVEVWAWDRLQARLGELRLRLLASSG